LKIGQDCTLTKVSQQVGRAPGSLGAQLVWKDYGFTPNHLLLNGFGGNADEIRILCDNLALPIGADYVLA